jgi:outer membrane protein OmpA-like peptidoglycan-associated protein
MSLLGGGEGAGDHLLDDELGRGAWDISDDVARSTGIRRESAHKLVGGVTSVALLALAKTGASTHPQALRELLSRESARGETVYSSPEHAYAGAHTGPAIRTLETPHRSRWWLWAALLALAAIIAIPLILRGLSRSRQAIEPKPTPGEMAPVPQTQAPTPAPAPEPQAAVPEQQQAAPPAAEQQQAAPPAAEQQQATPPAAEQQAAPPAAEQQQAAPPMGEEEQAAPAAGAPTEGAPPAAETPQAAAPSEAPAGEAAAPSESSVGAISAFLANEEGSTPRTFTLEPLNYGVGDSDPTSASMGTIDELAESLSMYPSAEITLDSHTDATGSTAANNALAMERSEAVKALLVERGIDESRITTTGQGRSSPIDSNATAAGRANNRRTDVIVTSR